jgi:uncharacterized protein YbjQ (UPF0145 family)
VAAPSDTGFSLDFGADPLHRGGRLRRRQDESNLDFMLVVTTNDIPGWEIQGVLGEVIGLAVRPNNAMGLKRMIGAELQLMLKNLAHSRQEALSRLVEEAHRRGGNAVVAMRFDTTDLGSALIEICAYGTAVQATPLTESARHTAQQLGYGPQTSETTR